MNFKQVSQFLESSKTCVIATVDDQGKPMAATVGFSHDENFEIIVATSEQTQKYKNILANPKVALVVGFELPYTVQYEGLAKVVTAEELGDRLTRHFEKVPAAKKFAGTDDQKYILITPEWMRFSDMTKGPEVHETRTFK